MCNYSLSALRLYVCDTSFRSSRNTMSYVLLYEFDNSYRNTDRSIIDGVLTVLGLWIFEGEI